MLSILAAAAAAGGHVPLYWLDLHLTRGIDLHFFTLRWYSLAYLTGIVLAYWHVSRSLRYAGAPMAQRHADDLFFYCTLGVILGGRLGYALFYTGGDTGIPSAFTDFSGDGFVSWKLLRLWDGGMSFHGGLAGVTLAMAFVAWQGKLNFIRVVDYVAVGVPMGMLLGRLANFVNGELWGRVTNVPWAMVFPAADDLPRHPIQLYQAGLEGLAMLVIMMALFWFTRARYRPGLLAGVFTLGMGISRFVNEFFREPDQQLADFAARTGLSMGQWLTIPLILTGLIVVIYALLRKPLASGTTAPA